MDYHKVVSTSVIPIINQPLLIRDIPIYCCFSQHVNTPKTSPDDGRSMVKSTKKTCSEKNEICGASQDSKGCFITPLTTADGTLRNPNHHLIDGEHPTEFFQAFNHPLGGAGFLPTIHRSSP